MTLTDDLVTLNTAVADPLDADVDLLDAFAPAQDLLGGSADYQRLRLRAATRFLEQHPDLGVWMTRPIEQRLVDVRGASSMWPLVTFALISTPEERSLDLHPSGAMSSVCSRDHRCRY